MTKYCDLDCFFLYIHDRKDVVDGIAYGTFLQAGIFYANIGNLWHEQERQLLG